MELFVCPSCRLVLWDPVTVSCGHSFCRRCLGETLPSECCLCGEKLGLLGSRTPSSNVLLGNLLEKGLNTAAKVARLKRDLRELVSNRDFQEALRTLEKGIDLAPDDLTLRVCRSELYVALQEYEGALEDLEILCKRKPEECEGFFRKGKVLLDLGNQAEALLQFQHCLTLDSSFHAAEYEIEKILTNDASPTPGTLKELKNNGGQNLEGCNSREQLTFLGSFEGETLLDMKTQKENWLEDTMPDPSQAALPMSQWMRKKFRSDLSANKEDSEEEEASPETSGTRSPDIKSAKDYCLDFMGFLTTSDLECSLCIRMLYEPVTTPCGHTFCKECMERCLDHRPNCPLCKQSLQEYLKAGKYNTTILLEELMTTVFPSQLAERKLVHQAEMVELSNLNKNIPIFVCTMSFPGLVCPLHVFEPRYRLMMRRCQETGTKMFGMCMYENGKNFADYGCILEIQKIAFFPDGRSLVDTIGKRRFRVLRRGHRDGYNTADVEYLEDEKMEGEEQTELQNLHDCTYELTQRFYEHGGRTFRQLVMHHGPLPEKEEDIQASPDGPVWCWWLISVLPLDLTHKLTIFSETSLKARLTQLKHILNIILESRDYSN
ncbi:LON peptidase N-terminal domain and RING finger protein 1-like isoform X1 [Ahaetulla prasina]|uniref:LON peptidase N-terminal domain and RING finger protein 1-like isoform X1 n=1 Tax=Ahaetulla prasina TaxID=499056 RepID=UPI002647788E|nr:LON peptidase N-terminal domain and RING finger protein 1-like isoform X1 [Ahaetulla prasina]